MFKTLQIEKVFVFLSLIFGFLYVILLPPFQSPDEAAHFYRSYEIASGHVIPKNIHNQIGDYLPESLEALSSKYEYLCRNINAKSNINLIKDSFSLKLNPAITKFISFPNTALYSPVAYLTQLPGMFIGVLMKANPLVVFYLGRISNLLIFTFLMYQVIRTMPCYKLTTMLVAMIPMTLSLAGALTADSVVICFNFLWVALLMKILYENKQVSNAKIITLLFTTMILSLSKYFVFLIPLVFLIPKSKFRDFKNYLLFMTSVFVISILSVLVWQSVIGNFSFNTSGYANPVEQINFILHHPFMYTIILLKTLVIKFPRILITMVGVLGWLDTKLDFLTYMLYPILIVLSVLITEKKILFSKFQSILILLVSVISAVLISTELYVIFSKAASPIIYGLCGRYYIPIVLPFLFLAGKFINIKISDENRRNLQVLILILLVLILISSDLSLIQRYYTLTPDLYYKV